MRTPTPDLDKLWAMHGIGERFQFGDDSALQIYDNQMSLKTVAIIDVSWVAIEQVIHARIERTQPNETPAEQPPASPFLKAAPSPWPIRDVTSAELRAAMPPTIQPDLIVAANPTGKPDLQVLPRKKLSARLWDALRG